MINYNFKKESILKKKKTQTNSVSVITEQKSRDKVKTNV